MAAYVVPDLIIEEEPERVEILVRYKGEDEEIKTGIHDRFRGRFSDLENLRNRAEQRRKDAEAFFNKRTWYEETGDLLKPGKRHDEELPGRAESWVELYLDGKLHEINRVGKWTPTKQVTVETAEFEENEEEDAK